MSKKKLLRSLDGITITAEDAGRLLARSRQWVEKLVAKGFLKPIEKGLFRPGDVVRAQIAHMAAAHQRAQSGGVAAVQTARALAIKRRLARADRHLVAVDEIVETGTETIAILRGAVAGLGTSVTDDAVICDAIDGRINDALSRASALLARRVAHLRRAGRAVDDADDDEPQE
jgi:hypothetical protein